MTFLAVLTAALIQLPGVTGENLRARAFFDANNVKVGDPLTLTVDFLGNADFKALHPPSLSDRVERGDWKVYDESAKTDTYRDARRLTYRVRPMRKGLLRFPALEFSYVTASGEKRTVKSNEIPVHSKSISRVAVAGMDEAVRMPQPDALIVEPPPSLSEDELFAWRKACAEPSAAAFARFDFPAARLNEARCAVMEGNWARAMKLYGRLEWILGQTPAVERGMVAALARRYENPHAQLPVWREVGRPILRHPWQWRLAIVAGGFLLLSALLWAAGKIIRMAACIAAALLLVSDAAAQGIFRQMEEEMEQMRRQMRQSMGTSFSFGFGGESQEPVSVAVSVEPSKKELRVGDAFEFVVSLDVPKFCSIGQIRITPSEMFGMTVTGRAENLPDAKSDNPSNVVKRLSVPVRYDVPFRGEISFSVSGMVSRRNDRRRSGGFFSFTSSTSFRSESKPIAVDVRPPPESGQPEDYAGVVSADVSLREFLDIGEVETNDVIQITYELRAVGFIPADFMPKGAAFEIGRDERGGSATYRRFFVADGTNLTPRVEVPYYDPESKSYRRASCGGSPVKYRPANEGNAERFDRISDGQ